MNQTMIYDYLGVDTDPLWNSLELLQKGQLTYVGTFEVLLNSSGIYEVTSDESHDGFNTIRDCYQFLLKNSLGG